MSWDRIINSLLEIKSAVREKMGDDGTEAPRNGHPYKDGPGGFDRIQYEIGEIAAAIRRSADRGAAVPAPPGSGTYILKSVDGAIQWEEEETAGGD
jgi:hypothetical protein